MRWLMLGMLLVMPFEKNPYLKISDNFLGVIPDFTVIKCLGMLGLGLVFWQLITGQVRLGLAESPPGRTYITFLLITAFAAVLTGAQMRVITRIMSLALLLPIMLVGLRNLIDFRRLLFLLPGVLILCLPYAYRQYFRFGGRLGVGLYEANYFALALILLIPLAFIISRQQRHAWLRYAWLGGVIAMLASVVMTGSRGGFVGGLICLIALSIRVAQQRVFFPMIAIVGLVASLFIFPTVLAERLLASGIGTSGEQVQDAHGVSASNEAHSDLFYAGLRMIQDKPIFGVGLGRFKDESMNYFPTLVKPRIAHNTYLHIGAESGLIALGCFVLFLIFVFQSLNRSAQYALALHETRIYEWVIGIQCGLCGWFVSAFFVSAQYEKFFWALIFMTIVLERLLTDAYWERVESMSSTLPPSSGPPSSGPPNSGPSSSGAWPTWTPA